MTSSFFQPGITLAMQRAFLHTADDDFGDQFAMTADEEFTVFDDTLQCFADVDHYEIPLARIGNNDLALQVSREGTW